MPTDYDSVNVKCPYYKGESKNTIQCEDFIGETCNRSFKNTSAKKIYKEANCCSFGYKKCSHFQEVNHKYL